MVSCRNVDWSCAPNVLLGGGVMAFALWGAAWQVPWYGIPLFLAMFVCGVALAYGFLLMLTAASVWFMRNQSLMEMWWLFGTLMRYPREIFLRTAWVSPIGLVFSTLIPIMLVTNVPARVMVNKALSPWAVVYTGIAAAAVLWVSRRFFRAALLALIGVRAANLECGENRRFHFFLSQSPGRDRRPGRDCRRPAPPRGAPPRRAGARPARRTPAPEPASPSEGTDAPTKRRGHRARSRRSCDVVATDRRRIPAAIGGARRHETRAADGPRFGHGIVLLDPA